ncbi:MAG TPA: HAD-IIIC family phosphatase [Byssovorax sp.]|jgi:FkbH-like protein
MSRRKIAVAATFTAEPLLEVLDFWADELELELDVEIAPYNQVFQQLLDPTSVLGRQRGGLNVVLIRLEDWAECGAREGSDLARAITAAATASGTPHLLCFCPPSPARGARDALVEDVARAGLAGVRGVDVVRSSELADLYPVADFYDAYGDEIGKIPYTPAQFAAIGTLVARRVYALGAAPCKVIASDCDDTLWAGVAAEDGPLGVVVDEPRRALQRLLVERHDAGVLVCLCSKNEEADVAAVLDARVDMPLRPAHVAAQRIGWGPKAESLRSLSAELGLGLDSFVFLDDSPLERAGVRAACPEVVTPELPEDPARVPGFLRHFWALDRAASTAEDRRRTTHYREEQQRVTARRAAPDLEAFLDGLALEVAAQPMTTASLPRAAQLTQRTNQLNFTTTRYTEAELLARLESSTFTASLFEVRDRFGDYGTTGLALLGPGADALEVDTFLLSCRALGRGVEERMLAHVGRVATERGFAYVDVPFVPTQRNTPARELLEAAQRALGAGSRAGPAGQRVFRFAAAALAGLQRLARAEASRGTADAAPIRPPPEPRRGDGREALLNRVAAELSEPTKVVEAIARRRLRGAAPVEAAALAAGSVEDRLASIWREVLHLASIAVDQNFFDIGGQSIAMVRVLSRVREALGVDVPPAAFFAAPTIAGLSRAIAERSAPAVADTADVVALLDLIEGLSPAEVTALLGEATVTATVTASGAPARPAEAEGRGAPIEAVSSRGGTRIAAFVVPTCDRPEALERALSSYLDNFARHGREIEVAVLDDSKSPAARARNRELVRSAARARGVAIAYGDVDEEAAFAQALVARGVPPRIVGFALAPGGATPGSNRNSTLLQTVGDAVFSADDDTICQIAAPPVGAPGLAISSQVDPADYWFFPDRASALAAFTFQDRDVLADHEALLGRGVRGVLSEFAGRCSGDAALASDGRVVVTFNGLVGDCGWHTPFGSWIAPTGYLSMRGASQRRLCASEATYGAVVQSREIGRVVDRPHLADLSFSMTTFFGLDNRALLPPFPPIGRGEDFVFGALLAACTPDARAGHVPWALVHAPWETRRFWPGEIARTASSTDLCRILVALIRSCPLDARVASPAARMSTLGAHLIRVASRPERDFEAFVRSCLGGANRRLAAWLEERLSAAGGEPAWWARDVRRYLADLSGAAEQADYPVALDLAGGASDDEARARTRSAVRLVGELLEHWPAMVDETRALRARGVRPATLCVERR